MNDPLMIASVVMLAILIILVIVLLTKSGGGRALEQALRDEIRRSREEAGTQSRQDRAEITEAIKSFSDTFHKRSTEAADMQDRQAKGFADQIHRLTASNEERLDKMRAALQQALTSLQEDNANKLEQMRVTVDEKLHGTLEKRLSESFRVVSDQLSEVHKGLGEMRELAKGVGDLKAVLTNVKVRGTWGEIGLQNLLD
ncbi:MAG TPA: DNA recombination protein RmuC, partial [Planctomycetota bacterium]|nr:DNA recombination protein RmuC [Planctomycetota bacterium]